jgi:hypothetical protein
MCCFDFFFFFKEKREEKKGLFLEGGSREKMGWRGTQVTAILMFTEIRKTQRLCSVALIALRLSLFLFLFLCFSSSGYCWMQCHHDYRSSLVLQALYKIPQCSLPVVCTSSCAL